MNTARSLLLVLAASLVLFAPAALAGGNPQDYSGNLDIYVGELVPLQVGGGGFSTSVSPPPALSFDVPAGSITGSDNVATGTGKPVLAGAYVMNASNASGSLSSTGGMVSITGSLTIQFLAGPFADFGMITVPLSGLGAGGTAQVTSSKYGEPWTFVVDGAQWQTGTVQVGGGSFPMQTFTGADSRTELGAGELRVVAPMRVTAIRGSQKAQTQIPVTGQLLIPEPGLLALQLSAAGLLAAMGWNRRKQK